jgi:hypothetical protein
MTPKEAAIEMIRRLPEDATISDIMAALYVRLKIETGLRQLDEGKGIEHEEAEGRLSRWLQ